MTMTSDGTTKKDRARATGTSAPVPAPMAASHTTAERRGVRDRVARRSLEDFPVTGRAASRPTRNHQETRSRDGAVLPAGRALRNEPEWAPCGRSGYGAPPQGTLTHAVPTTAAPCLVNPDRGLGHGVLGSTGLCGRQSGDVADSIATVPIAPPRRGNQPRRSAACIAMGGGFAPPHPRGVFPAKKKKQDRTSDPEVAAGSTRSTPPRDPGMQHERHGGASPWAVIGAPACTAESG